jgi:hypothetical protein
MRYLEEAKFIWKNFVPPSGQADTVQGELLRAVEKLRDESLRNGNANWDDGHETLVAYLRSKLSDTNVFSGDDVSHALHLLDQVSKPDEPYLSDSAYDELGERVVEYFRYHGSQPHQHNPALRR